MPDETFLKEVAAQLRKPTGEFGSEVASAMNESNKAMNLSTISSLQIEDGNHILEVGMGNGFFVSQILARAEGLKYTGVDYSEDMVHSASLINKKHVELGHTSFFTSHAHKLPVTDHSIDRLFTVNTIYFWENRPAILDEFKRVLKSNGLLAIAIRPERCMKEYPSTQFNFDYYTPEQVCALLTTHGFTISKVIEETEPETEVLSKAIHPEFSIIIARIKHT